MIITDGVHLTSTVSYEELHDFAAKIGLKRCWFQDHEVFPHYDLTTANALARAMKSGAKMVGTREWISDSYTDKPRGVDTQKKLKENQEAKK